MTNPHPAPAKFDVVVVGGGPAGLAAALTLGRACRGVMLFDAGPRRNATATRLHNFVTRDGIAPGEFRRIARDQLKPYTTVQFSDAPVLGISGTRDAFVLGTAAGEVQARRVILTTGMVDELPPIPGFREAWGASIFQCPYCHGFEHRGGRWGYLALDPEPIRYGFVDMLKSWTDQIVVFTAAGVGLASHELQALEARGITVESRTIVGLDVRQGALAHVKLEGGTSVPCDALYAHPPQRQVALVQALELARDAHGFVQVDPMSRATSIVGIYAAGDLCARAQGAIFAAAMGSQAAAMANHDLCTAAV
jgi:thioredoxin reductase